MAEDLARQKATARRFGFQWRMRRKKMFELNTLYGNSKEKEISYFLDFFAIDSKDYLQDKWVLDAGCGSALTAGAVSNLGGQVVAVDISNPVWPRGGYKKYPNLHLVQADILNLPFVKDLFDFVWCRGVLQYTSDSEKAIANLANSTKPRGKLYIWATDYVPHVHIRRLFNTTRIPCFLLYILSYLLATIKVIRNGSGSIRFYAFHYFDSMAYEQSCLCKDMIVGLYKKNRFEILAYPELDGLLGVLGRKR